MSDSKAPKGDSLFTLRSAMWPVYLLSVPLALAALVMALDALKKPAMWTPAAILFAIAMGGAIYPLGYRVELRDRVLTYRWLFHTVKTLRLEDIESAAIEVAGKRYRDRFRPWIRLVIRSRGPTGIESLDIPIMVFRNEDASKLAKLLNQRGVMDNPSART
jgi:hypothetical protein